MPTIRLRLPQSPPELKAASFTNSFPWADMAVWTFSVGSPPSPHRAHLVTVTVVAYSLK